MIGASGLVGAHLLRAFRELGEVVGTYHSHWQEGLEPLDITDRQRVAALIQRLRPGVVLCPAAIPSVELCELQPEVTRRVNVEGMRNVIEAVGASGGCLVYFSSDYVFDGARGPYSEDDATRPINEYGRQKLECERLVEEKLRDFLVVRTSTVYGWEEQGKNFVMRLLREMGAGREVRVPCDQMGTPTYAPNLALAVRELVSVGHRGVYHVVGSERVDRYRLALMAAEVFGLDSSLLVPVDTRTLGQAAPRPLDCTMRCDKARAVLQTPLLPARQGLEAMRAAAPAGSLLTARRRT